MALNPQGADANIQPNDIVSPGMNIYYDQILVFGANSFFSTGL